MNHLRSLGLSAGRKNARICQRMTGAQATMADQMEILNRVEKPSNGSKAIVVAAPVSSCGM